MTAAGQDDDEWRSRLERGQNLAREAEAARRGARDAQRNAEETIAEQAAEIQRLREEARSRAPGRWRRPYDVRINKLLEEACCVLEITLWCLGGWRERGVRWGGEGGYFSLVCCDVQGTGPYDVRRLREGVLCVVRCAVVCGRMGETGDGMGKGDGGAARGGMGRGRGKKFLFFFLFSEIAGPGGDYFVLWFVGGVD